MYQELETLEDLKQKIEDWFIRRRRNFTEPEVASIFKRSGADRVSVALTELVKEGKLLAGKSDPVAPPHYQLTTN